MKNLSLKKLKLSTNDLLQAEQLKNVFGGYHGHDFCANLVNDRIYELGQHVFVWDDGTTEPLYSDEFLMELGNEAYADCRGYDVPGW